MTLDFNAIFIADYFTILAFCNYSKKILYSLLLHRIIYLFICIVQVNVFMSFRKICGEREENYINPRNALEELFKLRY